MAVVTGSFVTLAGISQTQKAGSVHCVPSYMEGKALGCGVVIPGGWEGWGPGHEEMDNA